MRRHEELFSLGISFVDLFACGLGAVLMLWLVLTSSPSSDEGLAGESTVVVLRVLPRQGADVEPRIGVRCLAGGKLIAPTSPPSETGLRMIPTADGAAEYKVFVTGNRWDEQDRLLVYLHDFRLLPATIQQKVRVHCQLRGVRGDQKEFELTPAQPCFSLPLRGLADERNQEELKWRPFTED